MATPLSEVFSTEADEKILEPVVEAAAETAVEVSSDDVTVDSEVAAVTEEQAAPTAVEQAEVNPEVVQLRAELNAFKTKALDEVGKRQALEAQIKQAPVEKPDAYVEPDKAIDFGINELKSDFDNKFLNLSEFNARGRHADDFDQMTETFFTDLAVQNPSLQQQALQHPDPYEFIYQQAKNHNEFKDIGSVDDLRAKIEAETRTKVEAEFAEKQKVSTEKAITDSIPRTLSTATAAGGNKAASYAGPTPLNKIFPTN